MLETLALALLTLGFLVVLVGVLLTVLGSAKAARRGEAKGAFVVLLGPIPIIGGTDSDVIKLAIVLTIVVLLIMLILLLGLPR